LGNLGVIHAFGSPKPHIQLNSMPINQIGFHKSSNWKANFEWSIGRSYDRKKLRAFPRVMNCTYFSLSSLWCFCITEFFITELLD